jgi:hypothetical protein
MSRRPAYSTVAKKLLEVIDSRLCEMHQDKPIWVRKCELCELVKEARAIAEAALVPRRRKSSHER